MNILWKKPSGMEIETNDMEATVAYCEGLGWTRVGEVAAPAEGTEVGADDEGMFGSAEDAA